MAKTESAVAVEFDTPTNSNVNFAPLQRTVRGRFDLRRDPNAGQLLNRWPEPIPGQLVQYDFASGEGFIVEPLHEERYAAIRERIEALGMKLTKEREAFVLDAATFAYWMAGLIESGDAKLLAGTMPTSVEGKPRTRFHSSEEADPIDKLSAAIERQTQQQNKLLAVLIEAVNKLGK
ncbi:MAG: hypothetical protein JNL18_10370 [Planctomycetaceae bacterium]|nr:hypothetical protein [Planctomycetaceae bacterium]